MNKRYVVFGFSILIALALAVPALGGPTNPVATTAASTSKTAKSALKKAKSAQKTANAAKTAAAAAQTTADAGKTAAAAAQTSANTASTAAAAANTNANSRLKTTNSVDSTATGGDIALANCLSGDELTGGGFVIGAAEANEAVVTINGDYGNGWIVNTTEQAGQTGTWDTTATAICAST